MSDHPKVSAVVIAYNDETRIRACLESVAWADELIVVDSYSQDQTAKISAEFTDKVFQHPFEGFGKLRNDAVAHATHDWIFSLDSDERATPDIAQEISRRFDEGIDAQAFFVPRLNFFLGRQIRHCGWYPDYRQPQFFHRRHMRYKESLVHESFECDGKIGYFRAHVEQVPFRDIDHYLMKMDRYSTLMAQEIRRKGRTFSPHQLLTHPLFTFFKMYVMRRGFLDGKPGLILSGLYAYYTFVKYAKLWEMTRPHAAARREAAEQSLPLPACSQTEER